MNQPQDKQPEEGEGYGGGRRCLQLTEEIHCNKIIFK